MGGIFRDPYPPSSSSSPLLENRITLPPSLVLPKWKRKKEGKKGYYGAFIGEKLSEPILKTRLTSASPYYYYA